MRTNTSITIFHKYIDKTTRFEKWDKMTFKFAWWFGGKGSSINKGYQDANDVDVRLPLKQNKIDASKISIGDILVKGTIKEDIQTQQDLKGLEVYNITSINNNDFGNNPHIHLGGK